MRLVTLDTNVVIWGLKQDASPGQEHMIPRTRNFLQSLDAQGDSILLPSVVVGELLTQQQEDDHPLFLALLERSFQIGAFDLRAASEFALIWSARRDMNAAPAVVGTREKTKVDMMLIATAISHGATCIYSEDSDISILADNRIAVYPIPQIGTQTSFL